MKTLTILGFLLFAFFYGINGHITRDLTSRIRWHSDSGNEPQGARSSNTTMADSNVPARRDSAWEAPIQFTSGWGDKWFYALAAEETTVHFAQGNNNNILYRRSTDEGKTWGKEIILGAGRIYLEKPFVVDGSNVYLVYFRNLTKARDWCCPRELGDMFLRGSTDGGMTWQPEIQLSTNRSALRVAVAASGLNVHVVWMDF
jgi:hypothetical protein